MQFPLDCLSRQQSRLRKPKNRHNHRRLSAREQARRLLLRNEVPELYTGVIKFQANESIRRELPCILISTFFFTLVARVLMLPIRVELCSQMYTHSAKTGFNVESAFIEPASHIVRLLNEGSITLGGLFDQRKACGVTIEKAPSSEGSALGAARQKHMCC